MKQNKRLFRFHSSTIAAATAVVSDDDDDDDDFLFLNPCIVKKKKKTFSFFFPLFSNLNWKVVFCLYARFCVLFSWLLALAAWPFHLSGMGTGHAVFKN